MAKIDKINKEIDLIKSFLFLMLAIVVSIIIGLISRYDNNRVDTIFWIGLTLEPLFLFVSFKITKILAKKMKELEEI
jgi:ABC-type dipeptide/oligopeptide/nickel transport system permease subunit